MMKTRLIRLMGAIETLGEILHECLFVDLEAGKKYDEIYREITQIVRDAPPDNFTEFSIISMTRDYTKNSQSPFWRCFTSEGVPVNVFKHDDPLKNTFKLFALAGFADPMEAMQYGDTINWTVKPITVLCVPNGQFWNVKTVRPRDDDQHPDTDDEPEISN